MLIIILNIVVYIGLVLYLAVNVYLLFTGNAISAEFTNLKLPAILIRAVPILVTAVCLYGLVRLSSWACKTVIVWNAFLAFMIGIMPWIMYVYVSFLTGIKLSELFQSVNSTLYSTVLGVVFIALCVGMRTKSVREHFDKRTTEDTSSIIDRKSKFEAQLWSEIFGRAHDGETNYKNYYYDKIIAEDDKLQVRNTLLEMLKLNRYSLTQKGLIAYVCADIGVSDALLEVNKLRLEAKRPSFENQMLSLAHEALLRGISVRELVYENHGSKP